MAVRCLTLLFLFLWLTSPAYAQDGGGEYDVSAIEAPLSDQERQRIQTALQQNIEILRAGKAAPLFEASPPLLTWPLAAADGQQGYYGLSNFVDQNPAFPYQTLDYDCGSRTYDLESGYNHRGIDYFLWPFPWYKMDHDEVSVVAAAPGRIVLKEDGNADRSCSFGGTWNAIYIEHEDGSIAWYGHLKRGSLTEKPIGATVERGEVLGIVGSSGSSTTPHLHLELYDAEGNLVDPNAGQCNFLNTSSWWEQQRPYYDAAVNALLTGLAPPDHLTCPAQELPHAQDAFDPGSRIYFTTFYRDQRAGQQSTYTIFRPDGLVYRTWAHQIAEPHYAASWWYWYYDFPASLPQGTWTFQVQFDGKTYSRPFTIGSEGTSVEVAPSSIEYQLFALTPNPFQGTTRFLLEVAQPQQINASVYDVLGRVVEVLYDGLAHAGEQRTLVFEAEHLPEGVYLLKVTGERFNSVRKVTLRR